MRSWVLAAAMAMALTGGAQAQTSDPVDAVDVFIGTLGKGHTFPGAVAPFGMVQLSPDTDYRSFRQSYDWASGYRHDDPTIMGFSHTHFSGTGHSDLGDVLITPQTGEAVKWDVSDVAEPGAGYRSRYDKASEQAEPGYYSVQLTDTNVRAELTTGVRTGLHRYTFAEGERARVLLDLRHSIYDYPGKVLWSRIRLHPDGTVTGFREMRGWAPGRQVYFAMRFSKPMVGHEIQNRETDIPYNGFRQPGRAPDDRHLLGRRGGRHRQSGVRRRRLRLRRPARSDARGLDRGARRPRHRRRAGDAHQPLYRAVSRPDRPLGPQ